MIWIGSVVAMALLVLWWRRRSAGRNRRRQRLLSTPLASGISEQIARTVPVYVRLSPELRARVDAKVGVFLAEKVFTGCKEVVVSDTLRWTVAGHACLLLAGRDDGWVYDELDEILIHPLSWRREQSVSLGDGLEIREPWSVFDGESWMRGPVVLSRGAIRRSLRVADGFNVVFHEFAHQLDAENGAMEGCPVLPKGLEGEWSRILDAGFRQLVSDDEAGRETFLDPYGAEHPSEYYAVAVESFLERPDELRAAHPDLFGVLCRAFGFDPATGAPESPRIAFDKE
jgi:MtfA peptidase